MSFLFKGILLVATAFSFGTADVPPGTAGRSGQTAQASVATPQHPVRGRAVTAPSLSFSPGQLEAYLDQQQIAYIRPGLDITINSVTVGSDGKPVVDLTIADSLGNALDRQGAITPGPVSVSFILSKYVESTEQPGEGDYHAVTTRSVTTPASSPHPGVTVTQPSTDSGGTWTELEMGHYVYKFKTPLPDGFDPNQTFTVGLYATRDLMDILGKNYYDNEEYDFHPNGTPVTGHWDELRTSACNQCHDPLAAHGGSRQDVKLCVLCHTSDNVDPDSGNSVDFKVMIHKIHAGENLPSVQAGTPYQIIGFQQSVHDFSTVAFPQDLRNCSTCHQGHDPKDVPTQSQVWYTEPSRAACGACHDDINWSTGANHPGGAQMNDEACSRCHIPDSGEEYDASIIGAHTVPEESSQLKGLNAAIVSVSNAAPGQNPTVVFKLTNDAGEPIDGTKLDTFAPILGGPSKSYDYAWRENGLKSAVYDSANGTTTYTFQHALPADATGTWTISGDFYRFVDLQEADGDPPIRFREAAFNPIKYVAVTGTDIHPRRMIVSTDQCNSCHEHLALHGGQRKNVMECVICHNPNATDESQRPADQNPPESISFQHLIHRIHSGENLTRDFTIFGFNGSRNNFNEVRFPGDRRDCAKCHLDETYTLPLSPDAEPVTTPRDFFSPEGPATAACLGCHDSQDAAAHAFLNTTDFGSGDRVAEACAVCHGQGADWAVSKVHAR
ncbi:MAG: OmcA/MtrC family decaheme c-type cytochrome [Thermoanaerobaculia bacterium]